MAVMPIDVLKKEFRTGLRGYVSGEVDKFLEEVGRDFELAYAENFELREKIRRMESELTHYRQIEATLQQTLVLAQQTAEEVKQSARQGAELILREAEQEKTRRLTEAEEKWEEIQQEIQDLTRQRELIRVQLKSFLQGHLELVDARDNILNISQGGKLQTGQETC